MFLKSVYKSIVHAFFPSRCPYCKDVTFQNSEACDKCKKILQYDYILTPIFQSRNISPFKYDGINKKAVLKFKFYNNPDYSEQFAVSMQQAVTKEYSEYFSDKQHFDIITCVPITKKRYYERGYNQSELIAKYLGDLLDVEYKPVLLKIKDNDAQHTLPKDKRKKNVEGVFKLNSKYDITNKNILLIDDIMTTGSTLNECINVLYRNGAENVLCATYATAIAK